MQLVPLRGGAQLANARLGLTDLVHAKVGRCTLNQVDP
jgi:hypothetical protein